MARKAKANKKIHKESNDLKRHNQKLRKMQYNSRGQSPILSPFSSPNASPIVSKNLNQQVLIKEKVKTLKEQNQDEDFQ